MFDLVSQLKDTAQLRWNRIHQFQPKIPISLEAGPYQIKTIDSMDELIQSFRLRHQVFMNEFRGLNKTGLDFDRFDYFFDHLIIIHKPTQSLVGTYRINCSRFSKHSYTALEFAIPSEMIPQGPYIELGRACIHKDYRKGAVISLLWRGIAEYMNVSQSQSMFGCSSVKVMTAREAALIYTYLKQNNFVIENSSCHPTQKFQMKFLEIWLSAFAKGLTPEQMVEAEVLIPSLVKSYLKIGAKVVSVPAYDKEFQCIDLLTLLTKDSVPEVVKSKFKLAV